MLDDARAGDVEELKEIFAEYPVLLIPSVTDEHTGLTMLHMAAANGHASVVEAVLGWLDAATVASFVDVANELGNTALHWACLNGHLAVVQALCNAGADPFVKNGAGHDAIFEAENAGKEDVETWFLQKYNVDQEEGEDEVAFKEGTEIQGAIQEARDV